MKMKTVLIVGANSALATAFARLVAKKGGNFFLVARSVERLQLLATDLKVRGAQEVHVLACDLSGNGTDVEISAWLDRLDAKVDCALLAHGVLGDQSVLDGDAAAVRELVQVNFTSFAGISTWLCQKLKPNGGQLIVISSVAGERGKQSNAIYSSTMAARSVLADGLRHRFRPQGVNVLTVKLGPMDSPMTAQMKKGGLWTSPDPAAQRILKAAERRASSIYVPGIWCWIMAVIRNVPEALFLRTRL